MRDAHRMKERFDLSLDNRQVVSLLIGALVVLGAVFVLGVVVGKKLAGSDETRQADDILSALDRKAEQPVPAPGEVPLTFQEELTKKNPDTPTVSEPARPPDSKPGTLPTAEITAPPEPALAAEVASDVEVPDKPASAAPDELPVGAGKVTQEAVATRAAQRDADLKEAFARAAPARPPSSTVTGGDFTLQLSATQSRAEADRFAARLRDRGYAPYIVKAEVPGRGTWYRVRMGSFPTKAAAQRYLSDFTRETQLQAFVAPSR